MKLPFFCIQRPVFATVLSLILMLIGIMGIQNIKTRFFPRFETSSVMISTSYPAASAQLIETSITTPLEKSISGIEGIDAISSVSSQGGSMITAQLTAGSNAYDITNKIRNHVAMATSALPNNVQAPVVQMGHNDMDLMDVGFSIQGDNLNQLRDYVDRYVINRIQQLDGISEVDVLGANKYAMRITLHPSAMAARHITINDITQAINNNNLQLPAGAIQSPSMNFPITAKTTLQTADSFGNIVIKNHNGQPIYLKEISEIKLDNDTASKSIVQINGKPAILLSIYNTDSANPIDASKEVRHLLTEMRGELPATMHATVTFDQSDYMRASITEVYKTIFLAIVFVGIIIFFSLGKIRSSLIPIATIPICILSTMGFMYFLGFSINIITLLAIVLSIGLVVDDAIVVLENIHRHMESGLSRFDAAIKGSQEIAAPVIAMTLTLAAVYAPIGLIKGAVAHIFASFAFTLATAVIVSGFIALTLSPMMCSKLLATDTLKKTVLSEKIERFFHALTEKYQALLKIVLSNRFKMILLTAVLVIVGLLFSSTLPKTFLPKEDMGFLITLLNSETGTNDRFSENQLQQVDQLLHNNKNIETNVSLSFDQASDNERNMIFSTLKDYKNRNQSVDEISAEVNPALKKIPGLNAVSFAPSFGGSLLSEVSFYMMAPEDYHTLYNESHALIEKLQQYPGLLNLSSNIQFNNQQYDLTVNRALADQLQINVRTIDNTIAAFLGGETVSTFDLNGETYDVDIQAEKPYLQSIQSMEQLTVPSDTGQFIPLGNLITLTPTPTQTDLFHYNRLRAAMISAEIAPGYTMGDVVTYLQKTLPSLLPPQVKYTFTGDAERIVNSSDSMLSIFMLALLFIYLVLSAQFESFLDPLIILLSVPFGIVGALVFLKCIHGSINMYTMIGLVTLVGLIAKHGILITQFANALQKNGKTPMEALIESASIRLRPILMTTAAMIVGALPLLLASGASAVSRREVGTVFVGGLLFGTFFSLVLVPIAYSYCAQLKAKKWFNDENFFDERQ